MQLQNIQKVQRTRKEPSVFSILIPSWNNLPYLQACVRSIREHSTYRHQIIVHLNQGNDGSLEWLYQQPDIDFSFSAENIGICYALNTSRTMVKTDYIVYMNDDMFALPGWDKVLYDEVQKIGHPYFFLSGTAIEPGAQSGANIHKNYGRSLGEFRETTLLAEFAGLSKKDWHGATWPPNLVHRDTWDLVGGYSIEFSPGMYSDPDFSIKLWQAGIRVFKGLAGSRVYHFGSLSLNRVIHNKGYHQFISKWGVTPGTFADHYIYRDQPFNAALRAGTPPKATRLKNFTKRLLSAFYQRRLQCF